MLVAFCLNTGKRSILEGFFKANRKAVLVIIKMALRLRDRHIFM